MILSYRQPPILNYPVNQQPTRIDNVFSIVPGEAIRQTYECDQKTCGCGPVYTVVLTEARIIQRFEDHMCCCTGTKVDSMLFLSDISSIKTSVEGSCLRSCDCSCATILCFPVYLLCGLCRCFCSCCSKDSAVPISLNGAFGNEVFTFPHHSVSTALADIPAAAMPHKTSSHRSSN